MAMSRTDASIEPTRNGDSSSKNRSGDVSSASSASSSFADETTVSGEYRDDSTHHALPARNPSEDEAEAAMITKNKISNTGRWKLFVVALMFVNTTVVIVATSLFLNNEADKEFDRAFNNAAETVRDTAHYHAKELTDGLAVLGDIVTSYTLDTTGVRWPFITLPRFEERVSAVRSSANLEILGFLPVVETMEREDWEAYSVQEQGWIQESYTSANPAADLGSRLDSKSNHSNTDGGTSIVIIPTSQTAGLQDYSISPTISISSGGEYIPHPSRGPYAPMWQLSPPPPPSESAVVNTDLMSVPAFRLLFGSILEEENEDTKQSSGVAISSVVPLSIYSTNVAPDDNDNEVTEKLPQSARGVLFHPIRESYGKNGAIEGYAMGIFEWTQFFSGLLPDDINGITCVLKNPCEQNKSHTFAIHGGVATYMGDGDLHDVSQGEKCLETVLDEFDAYKFSGATASTDGNSSRRSSTSCNYVVQIFASNEFRSQMESNAPLIFTAVIAAVFIGTGLIFLAYVYLVSNRQNKVMAIAQSTSAIVASLFPATVRDQIMKNAEEEVNLRMSERKETKKALRRNSSRQSSRRETMQQLQRQRSQRPQAKSKPIADLFPETTVLFADIVGFTAWSSVREPTQVFELLETIYHSFDEIARRRGVFKVETIGDCYVAVTGLPDPCNDHAVIMCRFARDCLQAMGILTKKLETSLGPDTGELSMRFGLHSGAVTAGVLRGERARFQLFGDTVNTAARMESNGTRERIHISEQTANYLADAGKSDWFIPREDKIVAKGKGELQTYWLHTKKNSKQMSDTSHSGEDSFDVGDWLDLPTELFNSNSDLGFSTNAIRQCLSEQNQRLADWNSNQLFQLLENVVAHRKAALKAAGLSCPDSTENGPDGQAFGSAHQGVDADSNIVKDFKDCIAMPPYNAEVVAKDRETPAGLSQVVQQQLHDYVSIICSMYVDNPFHSYQHASHVTMSIIKILTSLAAPHRNSLKKARDKDDRRDEEERANHHAKTFGISSDPISHFALAWASLIHDVDHPGVTNRQLVKENKRMAKIFQGRCIAEQNSFQCAWDLLMDPSFDYLRQAIYTTKEEFHHFRDLAINAVLATDLFDKELNEDRQRRWQLAFPEDEFSNIEVAPKAYEKDISDRRATVVLEYVVQASDVAHTMQHWHVYRKWNERLFNESMKSHKDGRLDEDPCDVWYERELNFFDNTIIPMAKRLKGCGAFGVYFDEYLSYATQNRQEWERKGREIVTEMEGKFLGTSRGLQESSMHDESMNNLSSAYLDLG